MTHEQLRAHLLAYLKEFNKSQNRTTGPLNVTMCVENVRRKATAGDVTFDDEDAARLTHVVWDLILARILAPCTGSPDVTNDGYPFLSLTEHGRKVIAEQRPIPYDPDGYLENLQKSSPLPVSEAVSVYVGEALATFRAGNNLASAIMLGAAAEVLFVELYESMQFERLKQKMAERVNQAKNWLDRMQKHLPGDWRHRETREIIVNVGNLMRFRRNSAGHPRNPPLRISHEEMYALLVCFPRYVEQIYHLKKWCEDRTVEGDSDLTSS